MFLESHISVVFSTSNFRLLWAPWTISIHLNCTGGTANPWEKWGEHWCNIKVDIVQTSVFHAFVHLGKVVVVSQGELRDVDLHWIYDGEAAVPVLLRDHHCVTALWCLGDDITGCKETGNWERRDVNEDFLDGFSRWSGWMHTEAQAHSVYCKWETKVKGKKTTMTKSKDYLIMSTCSVSADITMLI